MNLEVIKFIDAKLPNKRISIHLLKSEEGYVFRVQSKTLVNFNQRKFATTDNMYSCETFYLLAELYTYFTDHSVVKNKILINEIKVFARGTAVSNLNTDN